MDRMKRGYAKRRCLKCSGNVFVEQDSSIDIEQGKTGWYEWCLQCGFRRYLKSDVAQVEEPGLLSVAKQPVVV